MAGRAQILRAAALKYPGVEEGIACKGTALECSSFKVKKKTFLFLGTSDLKVKLRESLPEAESLGCQVGANGWVTVREPYPPAGVLKRWLAESYEVVVAPKTGTA